eukprot:7628414-Pyramimonas_sp.AAC.1
MSPAAPEEAPERISTTPPAAESPPASESLPRMCTAPPAPVAVSPPFTTAAPPSHECVHPAMMASYLYVGRVTSAPSSSTHATYSRP